MTKLWILTAEVNEYDQYGEYFVAAFKSKPSFQQLKTLLSTLDDVTIEKLTRAGGGRHGVEHTWYNLREVESGEPLDDYFTT